MRVTKDAQRHLRAGHPWIYDGSILSTSHNGAAGDLAVIFNEDRDFLAIGLWDPNSPIRIRVLHVGKPKTIDAAFWEETLGQAADARSLLPHDGTTGFRVVNGENDGMPGFILDRYDQTLVLKLYSAAWLAHLVDIVPVLLDLLTPERLVLRFSRMALSAAQDAGLDEGVMLAGTTPEASILFTEHGLTFEANVIDGQKTGHFLDQRDNRHRVGQMARGKRVLDMFSCTGGFSVHAAAGGAELVHSVDLAKPALDTAEANMKHNRHLADVAACIHRTTEGDAFEVMERLARQGEIYDIIVIDPPSFAKRASETAGALQGYAKLTTLAMPLLRDGGQLVQASCSSRVPIEDFRWNVRDAIQAAGWTPTTVDYAGHALDHPVSFPEGEYLKAVFAVCHRR